MNTWSCLEDSLDLKPNDLENFLHSEVDLTFKVKHHEAKGGRADFVLAAADGAALPGVPLPDRCPPRTSSSCSESFPTPFPLPHLTHGFFIKTKRNETKNLTTGSQNPLGNLRTLKALCPPQQEAGDLGLNRSLCLVFFFSYEDSFILLFLKLW